MNGPAGRLEAILEEPEADSPVEAALVCHPHPKGGGTMHNKVVHRLARGLRKAGCVVLRFNYRGVNLSEGVFDHGIGETEDARTALWELHRRYPELPMLCAGFSFRIAYYASISQPGELAPASDCGRFPDDRERPRVRVRCADPKYFVQSTHDEYGPREEFTEFYQSLPEAKHLDWVEAIDHFFRDSLDAYEAVIERIGRTR